MHRLLAVLAALTLVVAACASDDTEGDEGSDDVETGDDAGETDDAEDDNDADDDNDNEDDAADDDAGGDDDADPATDGPLTASFRGVTESEILIGVGFVEIVDPYDIQLLRKTLRRAIRHPGPAVVVARHPCLMIREQRQKEREPIEFDGEDCNLCRACYEFGCPAIEWSEETGPVIDDLQCVGCGMCAVFCGPGALRAASVRDSLRMRSGASTT